MKTFRVSLPVQQPQGTAAGYREPLTLTSQFRFCAIPLRLDSYLGCGYSCTFCFARHRGGNVDTSSIRPASPLAIGRILRDSHAGRPGVLRDLVRRQVPIHFGGMSDPFHQAEGRHRVSLAFLRTLLEYAHPVIISTRSELPSQEPYLSLLRSHPSVVVQYSFSSSIDSVSARFEGKAPAPSLRLNAMHRLASAGVNVTVRWQPYLPNISECPSLFLPRVAEAGAVHAALEFLKVPLDRNSRLWAQLATALQDDPWSWYRRLGATRDGREYVLPPARKLPIIRHFATTARQLGLTVGIAENEFLYLSDGGSCCSGVGLFRGFENYLRHQTSYALSRSHERITYSSISREWAPAGSIDRFLNSRCRLTEQSGEVGNLAAHIRNAWNNPNSPGHPGRYYGVQNTGQFTSSGHAVFRFTRPITRLREEVLGRPP